MYNYTFHFLGLLRLNHRAGHTTSGLIFKVYLFHARIFIHLKVLLPEDYCNTCLFSSVERYVLVPSMFCDSRAFFPGILIETSSFAVICIWEHMRFIKVGTSGNNSVKY